MSGRRPHSRLPQSVWANNGVDERMLARRPIGARAWAGERTFGPPALPMLLEPVNGQQPWGIDRENLALAGGGLELGLDVLALAGGVVRVLQPTLADFYLWLVDVTASTPFLAGHCVGNREWGLRPQTPPPTEMSVLAAPAAPNPLSGRWFGCPGAGPIRAGHRVGGPTTALMSGCLRADPLGRERGPENGHPDRLPVQCFSEHANGQPPRAMDRDDLALRGGMFRGLLARQLRR